VGASTHDAGEWDALAAANDHAGVGPVFGTPTKADHAEPIGLAGLREGCQALRARGIPPIAIGGLTLEHAQACFEAGAESLAMVGEVFRSAAPAALGWEVQLQRWRVRPPFRRGQTVVLVGGMGAGKSTLGRHLAKGLGLPFLDLDAVIEDRAGCPVRDIFAAAGEAAFRVLEAEVLPELLTSPAVVALGGGAWESPANRAAVASADAAPLWLAQTPQAAWARVGHDPRRPLAANQATFMARWAQRLPAWSLAPMALPFGHSSQALALALLDC
jgi:shikimate kinase